MKKFFISLSCLGMISMSLAASGINNRDNLICRAIEDTNIVKHAFDYLLVFSQEGGTRNQKAVILSSKAGENDWTTRYSNASHSGGENPQLGVGDSVMGFDETRVDWNLDENKEKCRVIKKDTLRFQYWTQPSASSSAKPLSGKLEISRNIALNPRPNCPRIPPLPAVSVQIQCEKY